MPLMGAPIKVIFASVVASHSLNSSTVIKRGIFFLSISCGIVMETGGRLTVLLWLFSITESTPFDATRGAICRRTS